MTQSPHFFSTRVSVRVRVRVRVSENACCSIHLRTVGSFDYGDITCAMCVGRVVVQFLLETTSVPGAPYGAGNALAFMVNNGTLVIPIQVPGLNFFELRCDCPGPNIFLWTGLQLYTTNRLRLMRMLMLSAWTSCFIKRFVTKFFAHE